MKSEKNLAVFVIGRVLLASGASYGLVNIVVTLIKALP